MRPIITIFGVAGAVTVLTIGLKLISAFQTVQQEIVSGNVEIIGQFIFLCLISIIALQFLALANPAR